MAKTEESAFLFYESFKDTIEQAKKYGKGLEMYEAIMNYGLYHIENPDMDPIVAMGMPQIKVAIDHAQLRREEQQANGALGGKAKRAKIDDQELRNFISQGGSQVEAAKRWGVTTRTIQRHLQAAEMEPAVSGLEDRSRNVEKIDLKNEGSAVSESWNF